MQAQSAEGSPGLREEATNRMRGTGKPAGEGGGGGIGEVRSNDNTYVKQLKIFVESSALAYPCISRREGFVYE